MRRRGVRPAAAANAANTSATRVVRGASSCIEDARDLALAPLAHVVDECAPAWTDAQDDLSAALCDGVRVMSPFATRRSQRPVSVDGLISNASASDARVHLAAPAQEYQRPVLRQRQIGLDLGKRTGRDADERRDAERTRAAASAEVRVIVR